VLAICTRESRHNHKGMKDLFDKEYGKEKGKIIYDFQNMINDSGSSETDT